jgi:hypothetical protein
MQRDGRPERFGGLVDRGDVPELCALVDSLVLEERWDDVIALRDACRGAVDRGRQLWPAAAWAEFRLCLDAPAAVAAPLVDSPAARFTLGPFAEVLASTRSWSELAPWLPRSPGAEAVALECVVRGEDLRADDWVAAVAERAGMPCHLAHWEPRYPVATYHFDRVEWALPSELATVAQRGSIEGIAPGRRIADAETTDALVQCVGVWVSESNGAARAVAVEGTALDAIGTVTPSLTSVRLASVAAADAMTLVAWAAGGGGAHGRRRGASFGRFEAWWVAANLTGLVGDWPLHPDELAAAVEDLRWWVWARPDEALDVDGWALRLAVESPEERLAWALDARDHR